MVAIRTPERARSRALSALVLVGLIVTTGVVVGVALTVMVVSALARLGAS